MSVDERRIIPQDANRPTVGSGRATEVETNRLSRNRRMGEVAPPILHNAPGWSTGVVPP
jgi:hypothetical protein